jgi:transposase
MMCSAAMSGEPPVSTAHPGPGFSIAKRWRHLWAEGAYAGPLVDWVRALPPPRPLRLEMTKRSEAATGFVVIPKRWMVERTFGWCHRYRRLSKDYELLPETREAIIQVTMIHLMIRRLARIVSY